MSEERLQILKMLEKGTIDAKEANELLGTLEKRDTVFKKPETSNKKPKFIKILVEENGQEKVNISIPMLLAKTALKIMPKKAKEQMEEQNVNLDEILSAINDETTKGKIVDINDDGDHVSISLE
ncbi:MAG TPA: hypothetical protein VJ907_06150 [Halanaerobiales bacterium]|nr:hypothetical protein [Halanaerobiales bacterium]